MASMENELVTEQRYDTVWKIGNFDKLLDNEELMNSQQFELTTSLSHNTTCIWSIGIRKKAYSGAPAIKIFCRLDEIKGNSEAIVEALFQFEVFKFDGKVHHASRTKFTYKRGAKKETLFCSMTDVNKLYSLSNSTVVVNMKMASLRLIEEDNSAALKEKYRRSLQYIAQNTLLENMVKLLSDEELSDIKIITSDDVELHAHKIILQMQNPVFANMLRSDLSESKSGTIKVDDICGKTMRIILRYIYTGDLLPTWSDADVVAEFTYAAGKYQLSDVLTMLDDTLGRGVTSKGYSSCLLSLLSLTNKLALKRAEARLLEQFVKRASEIQSADELFTMMRAEPNELNV